jgi:hypothetical protein
MHPTMSSSIVCGCEKMLFSGLTIFGVSWLLPIVVS